jgi:hypothetical protein
MIRALRLRRRCLTGFASLRASHPFGPSRQLTQNRRTPRHKACLSKWTKENLQCISGLKAAETNPLRTLREIPLRTLRETKYYLSNLFWSEK